jgi:hypothetical protein
MQSDAREFHESPCARRGERSEEFLATLVRAARTVGWGCDHVATCDFVRKAFWIAAKAEPRPDDLEPFIDTGDRTG